MKSEEKYCLIKIAASKQRVLALIIAFILFNNINFATGTGSLKHVTPKILLPDTVIFNTSNPVFKWEKVESANGYTVYLYHDNNVISKSSDYRLITSNEYKIFNSIKEGEKYSIKIRAYNENSWSNYSNEILFSFVDKNNIEHLNYPKVITKNYTIRDTLNKSGIEYLSWENVNGAEKYKVIIEGIEESPIFGNTSKELVVKDVADSLIKLDEKLLSQFDKYRWKIKSIAENQESKFSPYYYFEKREDKPIETNDPEDIIIRVKYAGFVDEMMPAKFYNGKIYLPLLQFFSQLKLNHKVDLENRIFSGMFMDGSSEHFEIDFKNGKIKIGENDAIPIDEKFVLSDLEYYLQTKTIEKITRLLAKEDMSNLAVTFSSDFTLPLIKQKINEKKLAIFKSSFTNKNYPLLYNRNKDLIKGAFFDYSLSSNLNANSQSTYYTNLNLGAELFGGDIQIGTNQNFTDNKLSFNQINYKWRYAFLNNKYISSISVGNNSVYSLQSYSFEGVQISNKPIEQRREFGIYKVKEKAKPNFKIEIYKNSQLVDIVYADNNGNYDVGIPFSYGTTILELHEIGPNGEYNIKNRLYQISNELIPDNDFEYNVNLGKLENSTDGLMQADAAYGVNDWLTTKIGADVFTNDIKNSSVYSSTSARVYEGHIANFTFAPNAFKQLSINSLFDRYANLNLSAAFYDQNNILNPTKVKSKFEGNIFLPFSINQNSLSFFIRADKTKYGINDKTGYAVRVFYNYQNISPSIEYNYYSLKNRYNNFESALMKFRVNYSLNINSSIFTGNIMDAGIVYDLMNKETNSLNINLSTTILRKFRVQLSHTTNFQNSISDTQLRFIFDLPFLRSSSTISKHSVSQSIIGSVSYNQNEKDFNFYNRGMIGKSAASFKFFVDQNMNQVYDKGETLVDNMDVKINSIGAKRILPNGLVLVNDLESYTNYKVDLIDRKNKNPIWFPYTEQFSFISDPNQIKEIQIPFYEAAEISGSVKKKKNGKLIPIPGLTIVLKNKLNEKITKIKTMSDGSYYHYGLQPGEYTITIDSEQLNMLKLKAYPQKIEKLIRSISLAQDLGEFNFVLE